MKSGVPAGTPLAGQGLKTFCQSIPVITTIVVLKLLADCSTQLSDSSMGYSRYAILPAWGAFEHTHLRRSVILMFCIIIFHNTGQRFETGCFINRSALFGGFKINLLTFMLSRFFYEGTDYPVGYASVSK